MKTHHDELLRLLIQCSEHVRESVIGVEHLTLAEVVGMGADGAATSRIDQIAEDAALQFFGAAHPSGNVLSEEVGFVDRGSAITFIVDPIDSTSNATVSAVLQEGVPPVNATGADKERLPRHSEMFGFPYFAFSVAALVDNRLVAACIRNLPTGDVFTAISGEGARYNNVPIRATQLTELSDAWVAMIRPSGEQGLDSARDLFYRAKRIRITGCSALDIALIGSGALHALVNPNVHRPGNTGEKVVDYAGGCLILEEAGGVITDTEGRPLPIDHDVARLTPILAAATPELHRSLIAAIHPDERTNS